jgi:hypothetical protein
VEILSALDNGGLSLGRGSFLFDAELESAFSFAPGDADLVALLDVSPQQVFREGILKVAFHRPAHGTGAIGRIIAFLDEKFLGRRVQLHPDVLVPDPLEHLVDFKINDPDEVRLLEHVDDDEVVEPIEEFRLEVPFGLSFIEA